MRFVLPYHKPVRFAVSYLPPDAAPAYAGYYPYCLFAATCTNTFAFSCFSPRRVLRIWLPRHA